MASVKTLRGTFAARPATAKPNTLYFAIDSQVAYIYENGAWTTLGPLNPCTPPPTSGWTPLNTATETFDTSKGVIMMRSSATATAGPQSQYRAQPAATYTLTVGVLATLPNVANNYVLPIACRQSSTQEVMGMVLYQGAVQVFKWTSDGTVFVTASANLPVAEYPRWLQVQNDGTNVIFRYSFDGFTFTTAHSETQATFITPDQVMVGVRANSTATIDTAMTIFDWTVSA